MSTKSQKTGSSRAITKTLGNNNINGGKSPAPAPAPTNAWARPLQPKRTTAPPPPGIALPKSSTGKTFASSPESSNPSSSSSPSSSLLLNRERLLHLSLSLIGQIVVLHQKNGAVIEGIFHTFTPFSTLPVDQRNKYVLKEIKIRKQPTKKCDTVKDGMTLIVPTSKVSCLHAAGITIEERIASNGTNNKKTINGGLGGSSGNSSTGMYDNIASVATASRSQGSGPKCGSRFATDTQISNSASSKNKDLVAAGNAWTADGDNSSIGSNVGNSSSRNEAVGSGGAVLQATNSRAAALVGNNKSCLGASNQHGSTAAMSGSIGQWDQFKANKELFNVSATFDENLYTTQLDTSQLDAKKVAEAERIANEIETTTTSNIHLAEERGFKVETDFDEEDLYSGVLTKDGKQRHELSVTNKPNEISTTFNIKLKNNMDASKASISTTSTIRKKTMNYAAAAAKADNLNSIKVAPPGFSGSIRAVESSASAYATTKKEEEQQQPESTTFVVTPEKKIEDDSKKERASAAVIQENKNLEENISAEPDLTTKETDESAQSSENVVAVQEKKDRKGSIEDESFVPVVPTETEAGKVAEDFEKRDKEEKEGEQKEQKRPSKLNANAKSFTFNPSAKSFTPSFSVGVGANGNPLPIQTPQHAASADPNIQIYAGGHPLQHPHYVQTGPMGQPGMVPMINPQYQGMRYPHSYGIEPNVTQMQQQPAHLQQVPPTVQSAPNSGNASSTTPGGGVNNSDEDDSTRLSREGDDISQKQTVRQQQPLPSSQQQQPDQTAQTQGPTHQQQPQQHQHQHQISMPYNLPPGSYFTGGIPTIPSRGPGYAQFITGPQQIAGRPGAPPYGIYPMQPGGMPHNMQMRGHSGVPYYPGPNGPIPYPPGAHMGYPLIDEGGGTDYRSRGGRSSTSSSSNNGRGRGRPRSGSGRGRGRSNNNSNHNSSGTNGGKNTQQQYNHNSQQQQQHSSPQQGQSNQHDNLPSGKKVDHRE